MKYDAKEGLKDLLESANQAHLTIYLEGRGGLAQLKRQIQAALIEAQVHLSSAMPPDELKAFLAPIDACLNDDQMLRQLRGSLGIFRTHTSFRVLSIPVEVKFACHVASTFHVKPLLRWMQWDSDFFFMGFESGAAHLYQGNQSVLRRLDSILFPRKLTTLLENPGTLSFKERRELQEELKRTFSWVSDWTRETLSEASSKLFLAGDVRLVDAFIEQEGYRRTIKTPVSPFFREDQLHDIVGRLRSQLRAKSRTHLEQALLTFRVAKDMNLAKGSISQIAAAAVQGKVKKLIIAENYEVFGKLDPKSGKLSVHPFDLDHEDDDLLDDLAQTVLAAGGEVFVAKREQIPSGAPILAILDSEFEAARMAENSSLSRRPGQSKEARYNH